jgi:MFS family permease
LRQLIPFIILGIVTQIVTFSTLSFIPLFAVDQFKTSEEAGGALLAVAHFAGLWAGPLGGYLSDRIGKVPVMLVVSLLAGPAVFLLRLVSLDWSIYAMLLIIGVSQYAAMPITESYIITHSPERSRSTILGIYYFGSRGGPGLLMPAMGWLSDHYNFATSFSIVGAAMLVIVIGCSLLLWTNRD